MYRETLSIIPRHGNGCECEDCDEWNEELQVRSNE